MNILRFSAVAIPQLLALLLAGAYFDLLDGWNHGDSAFGTLLALFLLAPLAATTLLAAETVRAWKVRKQEGLRNTGRWLLLAAALFIEALLLDLLILSQIRMH